MRQVQLCPFPRAQPGQRQRLGLTRDRSDSGLCLRSEVAQPVGSLLRLVVHGVDGRPALESVGRVAWCDGAGAGGSWMGLALVALRPAA